MLAIILVPLMQIKTICKASLMAFITDSPKFVYAIPLSRYLGSYIHGIKSHYFSEQKKMISQTEITDRQARKSVIQDTSKMYHFKILKSHFILERLVDN